MSRWKRVNVPARWGLTALALVGALSAAACGGGGSTGTGGSAGHTGTGGTVNTGGSGGTGGTASPGKITTTTLVTTDMAHARAFDATLSNDGSIVYFTGIGPNGAGVFSVPASGGTPAVVAEGLPFIAPFGIALSSDGKKLYVADPATTTGTQDAGKILAVDPENGTVAPVAGTEDLLPRALDVVSESGADQIYFSATKAGKAGLYKIPAAGGSAKELASAPLVDPEGVAVTKSGTVYVLDAQGSKTHRANVYSFDGTSLTEFLPDVRVGYPSGLALGLDDKTLVISSLDATKGSASLLIIDIFSKEPSSLPTDGSLDTKFEPGGLHRARSAQKFAWVSYDPAGASIYIAK